MKLEEKWIADAIESNKRFFECKFSIFVKFYFNELPSETQEKILSFFEGNLTTILDFNSCFLIPIYLLDTNQEFNNEDVFKIMDNIHCTDRDFFFFLYSVFYFCYYNFSLKESLELTINICEKCESRTFNKIHLDISFLDKNEMPKSLLEKILWLSANIYNMQNSDLNDTPKEIIALAKFLTGLLNNRKQVEFDIDEKYQQTLLRFKKELIKKKHLL